MTKTFYLMRHGQTLFNQQQKIQGACDSPLTPLGIEQAKAAARYLQGVNFDHAYSSTSERCSDTLELVTNGTLPYTRLKGLKEMNFGTLEGESEALNPKTPEGYATFFKQYGGETQAEVKERLRQTGLAIMEQADHQTVLAVSHGGACYHFLRNWHDEAFVAQELAKGFSNCCIFKYEYDNGQFKLVEVIRPQV